MWKTKRKYPALFFSITLISFFMFFSSGCETEDDESKTKKARVYVTAESDGGTLTVVNFLEPAENSTSESNSYSDDIGTTEYNNWTWYIYEVSSGEYDVYTEQDGASASNGRARVNLDAKSDSNEWAAVYLDTGGNLWGEESGGDFNPNLSNYP